MIEANLKKLFMELYDREPQVTSISGGGSSREYFRLVNDDISVVGVYGSDTEENQTFVKLSRLLGDAGVKVPQVMKVSNDNRYYLLQDLGNVSLFSLLEGENRMALAKEALNQLVAIQTLEEDLWEPVVGYKPFSERLVSWDLNYFKYDFLKPAAVLFDEEKLEDDFDKLREYLNRGNFITGLMYRDFQSRNVMVKDNSLWFIDFQGARKGPLTYDAVSFIWQAKAPFSFEEREKLCDYYAGILSKKTGVDSLEVKRQIEIMEIFRTLQVLGAYGFRGLIERKPHFLGSIPAAIKNLLYLVSKGILKEYPELSKISKDLKKKFLSTEVASCEEGKGENLTLEVLSFSYKKGYPENNTGIGGGFMFDCRAIHNPGRYDAYKSLTGKDTPVIEFLEKGKEASDFISNAVTVVSPSIERYIKRGFTSLQVGFGCTGGQHRSVYCAERFASIMKTKYPGINITVNHREQPTIK